MIDLYFCDGVAYVWNSKDWELLRSTHKICGLLCGALSSHPKQNQLAGLPLALMREETEWLVQNRICRLITRPDFSPTNKEECVAQLKEKENGFREISKANRIKQITENIDLIVAGKRRKLACPDGQLNKDEILREEISKLRQAPDSERIVEIPLECSWKTIVEDVSCDKLKPNHNELRSKVFHDLKDRGYYITSGEKFGSDFLVYPDDPMLFHASHMIRCQCSEQITRAKDLVAFGRLAVSVNKIAIVASLCDSMVRYTTMQWHDSLHG